MNAAQTWVKAVSVLPMVGMPDIPGVPALPVMEAMTGYAFDVASALLSAQREFALLLASSFVPEKTP